jgi:glycerol uptake facilitator-like aquaporin
MTVLASAMTVGSVSGGAFNPAVSTGLQPVQCIVAGRCQKLSYIWMYLIAALFANPKDHFYISKKQEQR